MDDLHTLGVDLGGHQAHVRGGDVHLAPVTVLTTLEKAHHQFLESLLGRLSLGFCLRSGCGEVWQGAVASLGPQGGPAAVHLHTGRG